MRQIGGGTAAASVHRHNTAESLPGGTQGVLQLLWSENRHPGNAPCLDDRSRRQNSLEALKYGWTGTMETTNTREEFDLLVRTLSHDMSANFMLLENSFSTLKRSLGGTGQEGRLLDQLRGQVAHVEACLQQSKRFLNDLAWLGQTGGVEMEPERVDLAQVVDDVLFEQRELLARREIEMDVAEPLPAVWCNRDRLKQIVTNLVRNAAHHGCDPTFPRITIGPFWPEQPAADEQGRAMAFQIHDNGPGMDRQYRREVFLPGRRLASTETEGSGMGLAIVKRIVDHYGGEVYIDPECQVGTAFVVSLPEPVEQPAQPAVAPDALPGPVGRSRKLQVDGRHSDRRRRQLHPTVSSRP